jgi:hypothetical protein
MVNDRYNSAMEMFEKHKKERLDIATKNSEPLFDVMYELEKTNKSENENYLLAQIYYQLGWKWKCKRFIESYLSTMEINNLKEWQNLLIKVEKLFELSRFELVEYRDLRVAKKRNTSLELLKNDFIVSEDEYYLRISITPNFDNLILLNKNVPNKEVEFSAEKNSNINHFIIKTNKHFSWTNNIRKELITYYNDNYIDIKNSIGRLDYGKADDEWYDGLEVEGVGFHFNSNGKLEATYTVYDYCNMNSGFHIETLDNTIIELYYNTDL